MIPWQQRATGEAPIPGCLSCACAGSLFINKLKQLFRSTPTFLCWLLLWCHLMGSVRILREDSHNFTSSFWQGERIAALIVALLECAASHTAANVCVLLYSSSKCPLLLSSLFQRHVGCVNMHNKAKGHSITHGAGLGVKLLVAHARSWDL